MKLLMVLSPAKTLNFSESSFKKCSMPQMTNQTSTLIEYLKGLSTSTLTKLLRVSDSLGEQNYKRYQEFDLENQTLGESNKQALLAFTGAAYQGLDASSLNEESLDFAQTHLRILCGLYGYLRPLDLIQPYRLEMAQKLGKDFNKEGNLYTYWSRSITEAINQEMNHDHDNQSKKETTKDNPKILLNLASLEVICPGLLDKNIIKIDCVFKDNGKVVAIHAKRARGLMCRYILIHQVQSLEEIKLFKEGGYEFSSSQSTDTVFIFLRKGSGLKRNNTSILENNNTTKLRRR